MTEPYIPDLASAPDAIDLQLAADSDEVVLPRDAAALVACALRDAGWTNHKTNQH